MNRWTAAVGAITFLSASWFLALAQNNPDVSAAPVEIKVTAKKYQFDPSTIQVPKGSHVRLIITSLDHDHGIKIEEFHVDKKLPKGEPVTVEFDAVEPGTFPFTCSVFCGLGHKKMKGEVVVE